MEPTMNKVERMRAMVVEARTKNLYLRVFDVRYCTMGIPEVCDDHIYYPAGSYEVIETGDVSGESAKTEKMKYPKMIPNEVILIAELTPRLSSEKSK